MKTASRYKRSIQGLWMGWERVFEWSTTLRSSYSGNFGICKMFVTKYHGKDIQCEDGTVIQSGDWVGELHLDNHKILHMLQAKGANRVALSVARMARVSLRDICAEMITDPKLSQVKALQGITLLHRGIIHGLGFETHPLERGKFKAFTTSYLRVLLSVFHPSSRERINPHSEKLVPMRLVLSRDSLIDRFSEKQEEYVG
ncbi:YkoP family protein [Paenibacillus segetis]|uniref:YkoP-like domain-containing protein n=1 Tax=Paenibacillus segetis TaxID=1325360 RepID=A0ABQ1YP55_9BACL|nr:polysaccharide deacetylase [Paenibacillus segetis]GGH31835.1 hypothetical protein GCM10008013_35840 [Paenibacillus segetis]